jgi:hypothetical protein
MEESKNTKFLVDGFPRNKDNYDGQQPLQLSRKTALKKTWLQTAEYTSHPLLRIPTGWFEVMGDTADVKFTLFLDCSADVSS